MKKSESFVVIVTYLHLYYNLEKHVQIEQFNTVIIFNKSVSFFIDKVRDGHGTGLPGSRIIVPGSPKAQNPGTVPRIYQGFIEK